MRSHPRPFQLGFCGFLGLLLTLLSGCNSDLSEVCSGKYDHAVTDAMIRLQPYMDTRNLERSVASLGAEGKAPQLSMSENERDQWQSWSESELKRVEGYLDWANLHRDEFSNNEVARRRLTDVANRLVAFHGYSGAGRVDRMMGSLKALESDRQEIQALFCKPR